MLLWFEWFEFVSLWFEWCGLMLCLFVGGVILCVGLGGMRIVVGVLVFDVVGWFG